MRRGKAEMVVEENSKTRQDDSALYVEPVAPPSEVEPIDPLPQKEPEKTILQEGKTLRLLALDLFGNREFWVYIYLENRDKIPNPNRVPAGM
ncbi:MAG: hypothetical protein LBB62_08005, partial [Proteiniphilum sp.]|nr:hypothetical protein [Proteiniphilum sp.]